MSTKKLTETQKRIKTIHAVFDAGFRTEKAIMDMSLEEMLNISCLTVDDIKMISELQKAVKTHKVISFLTGGEAE